MNSCLQRATRTDSGSAVDAAGIEDLPAQALSAQGALESRTRRRYRAIHTLLEQGWALAEIARELHLNHKTVQTFARATRVEDLLGHIAGHRPSKLDAQRDYLLRRWAEGCHPPTALHRELADRGLHCNVRPITRYLRTVQVNGNLPAPGPTPPKTRRLVGWIMRHPTSLEPGEQELLMRPACLCRGRSSTWVASSLLGHPHRDATVPGATSMGIGHGAVREAGWGPLVPPSRMAG
jgi:transposase